MSKSSQRIIAVTGATGAQGGGVLRALQEHGGYVSPALTRDPAKAAGLADEVVEADFDRPETLRRAFEGVYGVFANTNSFAAPDTDEIAQGKAMVDAAKGAGVTHFIWSTLPKWRRSLAVPSRCPTSLTRPKSTDLSRPRVSNSSRSSSLRSISKTWFRRCTQSTTDPTAHRHGASPCGETRAAFTWETSANSATLSWARSSGPNQAGAGQHLSLAGDLLSWDEVIAVLRQQGHNIAFEEMPSEDWDNQGPWAANVREMFSYFEAHTYFGPDATSKVDLASAITTKSFTSFDVWAAANMPVTG